MWPMSLLIDEDVQTHLFYCCLGYKLWVTEDVAELSGYILRNTCTVKILKTIDNISGNSAKVMSLYIYILVGLGWLSLNIKLEIIVRNLMLDVCIYSIASST